MKQKEFLESGDKNSNGKNEAFSVSRKKLWLERCCLIFSGVVFSLAFPSVNWAFTAWFALVPLFLIIRDKTSFQAFRAGYLWGFAWAVVSFFWIGEIESFNPPFSGLVAYTKSFIPFFNGGFLLPYLMAAVIALFPAVWAAPVPFVSRYLLVPVKIQLAGYEREKEFNRPAFGAELLFVFALAAWWCATEWIRSWIATGLPWNFLAVSQWRNIPLIQICEYTGIYGVSFLVASVNFSLALALKGWYSGYLEGRYRRPYPFIASLIIIMICVISGSKSMIKYRNRKDGIRFTATVLQGDIPQCRDASFKQASDALSSYINLSSMAVATKPDLVIWPETAVPVPYRAAGPVSDKYRSLLEKIIGEYKIPFLIGTIDFEDVPGGLKKKQRIYNSAFLISPEGEIADKYHKVHLVPFGEFVPFGSVFPCLKRVIGMGRDLSPGKDFEPLEILPGIKAGINICFEDVFPYVSRHETLAGADVLIVLTNDAWYPESDEPEQHLANSVFRAVENRRPMIRCGNNSGSCLILPNGVMADSIFIDSRLDKYGRNILYPAKRGAGSSNFVIYVTPSAPVTFYTRWGDIFILFCWLLSGFSFLWCIWSWREKQSILDSLVSGDENSSMEATARGTR